MLNDFCPRIDSGLSGKVRVQIAPFAGFKKVLVFLWKSTGSQR